MCFWMTAHNALWRVFTQFSSPIYFSVGPTPIIIIIIVWRVGPTEGSTLSILCCSSRCAYCSVSGSRSGAISDDGRWMDGWDGMVVSRILCMFPNGRRKKGRCGILLSTFLAFPGPLVRRKEQIGFVLWWSFSLNYILLVLEIGMQCIYSYRQLHLSFECGMNIKAWLPTQILY